MRLAKLPHEVQVFLNDGELEYSHARVLLNLEDPDVLLKVARRAVADDWSVDKLEKFVLFDPEHVPGRGRKRRRAVEAVRAGSIRMRARRSAIWSGFWR